MAYLSPRNQDQIARDTGLSLSQIAAWVTDSEAFQDGSGYTVFFRVDTPPDVLALVPQINAAFQLVVAHEDQVIRQRRMG